MTHVGQTVHYRTPDGKCLPALVWEMAGDQPQIVTISPEATLTNHAVAEHATNLDSWHHLQDCPQVQESP